MLILPPRVDIAVRDQNARVLADIMVSLQFNVDGRYYFFYSFGLTNGDGGVAANAAEIEQAFEDDQRLFIMDYKVPLKDCDRLGFVVVVGDSEFSRRRETLRPGWVKPDWVERWRRARNAEFSSETLPVTFDGGSLDVVITLNDARGGSHVRAV